MMKLYPIFLCVLAVLLLSCSERNKTAVEKPVNEWCGKQLVLPAFDCFKLYARDSMLYDYSKFEYKSLVVIGKTDCIGCKLNLEKIQSLVCEMDSVSLGRFGFIFC